MRALEQLHHGREHGNADDQHAPQADGQLIGHGCDFAPKRCLKILQVALEPGFQLLHVVLKRGDVGFGGEVLSDDRRQRLGLRSRLLRGEASGLKFFRVGKRIECQSHFRILGLAAINDNQALSAGELRAFLEDKLGKHAMPREIEFRDELPKTMIGKLSKKELVAEETAKYERAKAEKSGSG